MAKKPRAKQGVVVYDHPGAPTTYRPEYCAQLIELMKQGYTFEAFASDVECSASTLYNWAREHPEFLEAKALGESYSRKFFEGVGLGLMTGRQSGNIVAWIFMMKNRYGWGRELPPPDDIDQHKDQLAAMSVEDLKGALRNVTPVKEKHDLN